MNRKQDFANLRGARTEERRNDEDDDDDYDVVVAWLVLLSNIDNIVNAITTNHDVNTADDDERMEVAALHTIHWSAVASALHE